MNLQLGGWPIQAVFGLEWDRRHCHPDGFGIAQDRLRGGACVFSRTETNCTKAVAGCPILRSFIAKDGGRILPRDMDSQPGCFGEKRP